MQEYCKRTKDVDLETNQFARRRGTRAIGDESSKRNILSPSNDDDDRDAL